jgi:GMP reductase
VRIHDGIKLDFSDVLIVPKRSTLSSRKDVDLFRIFETRHGNKITGTPIIAANMATGNFKMLKSLANFNCFTAIAKHNNHLWYEYDPEDDLIERIKYGFYTIGMNDDELSELKKYQKWLLEKNINYEGSCISEHLKICIDIANGYSQKFADYVSRVRDLFPKNVIMAGNVCTTEMTQELIMAGADIIKENIGSGGQCTTRKMTGVGAPALSVAIETSDCAHGLGALICLDGGIEYPGDISKAFCANADFVMIGTLFAGTDECDGAIITKYIHENNEYIPDEYSDPGHTIYKPKITQRKYKLFYGMSSHYAQELHCGQQKAYRASEGTTEEILCKGPVTDIIKEILGGIRSACTYIGAESIKNMGKCGSFYRVNKIHNRF